MKQILMTIVCLFAMATAYADNRMEDRGVVYDVGLQFSQGFYSVQYFKPEQVNYDMGILAKVLRANTVRIEGEDLGRLASAARLAHNNRLKVFFNPWLMNADEESTVNYMTEAAKTAEQLRSEGVDIVFVAGCEYSIFSKGVFEGETLNDRIASMATLGKRVQENREDAPWTERMNSLNRILGRIVQQVRTCFKGQVTYSSGTWEQVDWSLFDIVGVDYYRDTQTDEAYAEGLRQYQSFGKPVYVMEVGCCAYEGAARKGSYGYAVLQGTTSDGQGIYENGVTPVRNEREQAEYLRQQIEIISKTGTQGMFVYVFSFPCAPYRESGFDNDMTAYSIVKSYPADDNRSMRVPSWTPKEAFFTVAGSYKQLEK